MNHYSEDNCDLDQTKDVIDKSIAIRNRLVTGDCELENGNERREYEERQMNDYFENYFENELCEE